LSSQTNPEAPDEIKDHIQRDIGLEAGFKGRQ
jgi:hypothetical protein